MAKDDLFDNEHGMVRMTFGEHLEDLRRRLMLALMGFIPFLIIGLFIGKWLTDEMTRPVKAALSEFYDARRVKKLVDLEKKRALGQEIRHEVLRLHLSRESLREAFRKAYPDIKLPEVNGDAAPNPESTATQPAPLNDSSTKKTETTKAQPENIHNDFTIELLAEVDHDELESAAQPDLYPGAGMMTLGPQEGFMAYMKVSIVAGLVMSSWWVIYQLWQFVAEGLFMHERKIVYRAMPMSVGLFLIGVVFCFFVVLPVVLTFFFGFNKWLGIEPNIRLSEWLGFATILPVIFGACFELPLVMLVLERVGILNLETYMSKWRHAILIISIVAMVVTPTTDPGSMMLLMGPMTALYGLGLAMVYMRHVRLGDVPPLSREAKIRLFAGFVATVYAIGVCVGFLAPGDSIDKDWWFGTVWKLSTLPVSYILKSQLVNRDPSWILGATLGNAALLAWAIVKLGTRIFGSPRGKKQ